MTLSGFSWPLRPFSGNSFLTKISMVVLLLGLVSVATFATTKPSIAVPVNINIGTVNTQGGQHWRDTVAPMLTQPNLRVLAIQEAGVRPPETATFVRTLPCPDNDQGMGAAQYEWNLGTTGRSDIVNIYFVEWNAPNGRTRMAMLTRGGAADRVRVFWPAGHARPTIGVYLQDVNTYFWNVHARRGTQEPRQLVEGLPHQTHLDAQANNVATGIHWVIMGDWNLEPGQWVGGNQLPGWGRIVRTFHATHQGGRELDYMVVRNGGSSHTYDDPASSHPTGSDHSQGVYTKMAVSSLTPN